jgi:hypothetical protein
MFLQLVSPDAVGRDPMPPSPQSFDVFGSDLPEIGWIVAEYEKQTTVADAQAAKTIFGMRLVAEIHNAGHLNKRDAIALLIALDQTTSFPGEIGQIYAAARREQVLLFVDHIHKLVRTGAKNIAIEVNRSLFPSAPPPPPKRGIVARLLFGEA